MNKIKKLIEFTNKLPKLLQFILFSSFSFLTLFTVMRIIFYKFFISSSSAVPFSIILKAFYVGFKFDLRLALLIHLPILLCARIKRVSLFTTQKENRFWLKFLIFLFSSVLIMFIADFGYYAYLQTSRIDATSLRFLLNPLISLRMVWESYPVLWFCLLYVVIVFLFRFVLNKIYYKVQSRKESQFPGKIKIYTYVVFILLFLGGIYGKFSHYPLRWSDAFFSNHYFASVVSLNPVLYFFETFKNRQIKYNLDEVKKYHGSVAKYLGIKDIKQDDYRFIRKQTFDSDKLEQPNIVIMLLESFAFYKTGLSGNPLNPTPNFDKLASEGILFNHYYSPHGGTARSVFTLLTGMPDVEAIKTSSRNPLIVNQHTIVNAFNNHEKYYFLGGSANWGNIRGILQNNIPGLKIYEEGSFTSPRIDVWGISDLHLFEEANLILREDKKPFFAIIQTSGNHKPYTIPKDNRGFKKITPSLKVEDYGFRSVAAYNAFRFMDHSIGVFFDKVKKEKYFDNTIFVLIADHGLLRKANHMSKAENELGLTDFHSPLLIYAPNKIKQGKLIEQVASEIDLLPTLASLTSTPYVNSTFGRNLFDNSLNKEAYAFTITHYAIHEIGLISRDFYYRANYDRTKINLYQLNTDTPTENVFDKFPEIGSKMEDLCFGIYESARYIRYNNLGVDSENKSKDTL